MREVAYFMFFKQTPPPKKNIVWILLKMQTKSRKKTVLQKLSVNFFSFVSSASHKLFSLLSF